LGGTELPVGIYQKFPPTHTRPPLFHVQSAVDVYDVAGDVAGEVGGEEEYGVGYVFGFTEASEGDGQFRVVLRVGEP
jgi:hypothetical protein